MMKNPLLSEKFFFISAVSFLFISGIPFFYCFTNYTLHKRQKQKGNLSRKENAGMLPHFKFF